MMFVDLLGWIGAILILAAYYLVSTKKVKSDSNSYQILNLVGAIALVVNTYTKGAIPASALNAIWALIAIKILIKK